MLETGSPPGREVREESREGCLGLASCACCLQVWSRHCDPTTPVPRQLYMVQVTYTCPQSESTGQLPVLAAGVLCPWRAWDGLMNSALVASPWARAR